MGEDGLLGWVCDCALASTLNVALEAAFEMVMPIGLTINNSYNPFEHTSCPTSPRGNDKRAVGSLPNSLHHVRSSRESR
jgi:hypothetical protein